MKIIALAAILSCLILSSCAGESSLGAPPAAEFDALAETPFPKFQGDTRNTGRADGSGATGVLKWEIDLVDSIIVSPIIGDGVLYVMTDKGDLKALSTSNGAHIWTCHVGGRGESTPALGTDGNLYVGGEAGIYGIDGATGQVLWVQPADRAVESSPNIGPGGAVFVGSPDGLMFDIDNATGGAYWWLSVPDSIRSSPALGRSEVYVNCDDGKMYAFDRARIGLNWTFESASSDMGIVTSAPVVGDDGTIYNALGKDLYAIDPRTRAAKWRFQNGAGVRGTPALDYTGLVLIGCNDRRLYAIETHSGAVRWVRDIETYSTLSIGGDNTVYVGSLSDGKLYALNGATGATKWTFGNGGFLSAPAVDGDGTLYAGTTQGRLYAIK